MQGVTRKCDPFGFTALHLASEYGRTETTRLLIKHGCCNIHAVENSGQTCLMIALTGYRISLETIQLLLDSGSNINTVEKQGTAPLIHALGMYSSVPADVIRLLIDHGSNANTINRQRPLEHAMRGGHVEAIHVLLNVPDIHVTMKKFLNCINKQSVNVHPLA